MQSEKRKLQLRKLAISDENKIITWLTDAYIIHHTFIVSHPNNIPIDFGTPGFARRYFDKLISENNRTSFAVMFNKLHIGNIGLKDINKRKKCADCFIEIGDKNYRNLGLGKLAMLKLIDFAFNEKNLNLLKLEVLEFNLPAIKIYTSLGFKTYSSKVWHCDEFGQYWQILSMKLSR